MSAWRNRQTSSTGAETSPPAARKALTATASGNTQRLVQALANLTSRTRRETPRSVEEAIARLLRANSHEYERMLSQVPTAYQRRVPIALAVHEPRHPTGTRFMEEQRLLGASHVVKAITRLRAMEIMDEENRFLDPLFRLWVQRHMASGPRGR